MKKEEESEPRANDDWHPLPSYKGSFYDIMLDRDFLDRDFLLRLEQLLDKGLCKPGLVFFC